MRAARTLAELAGARGVRQQQLTANPAAARRLRQSCRLVGAMVGALAGFRQQDAVHGLPLQLSADEVTLAAERGASRRKPSLARPVAERHAACLAAPPGWVMLAKLEPPEPPADQAGSLTIVRPSVCSSAAPKGKRHRPAPVSWNSMAQRKSTVSALESAALIRGRTCSNAEMEEQPWKVRRLGGLRAAHDEARVTKRLTCAASRCSVCRQTTASW